MSVAYRIVPIRRKKTPHCYWSSQPKNERSDHPPDGVDGLEGRDGLDGLEGLEGLDGRDAREGFEGRDVPTTRSSGFQAITRPV